MHYPTLCKHKEPVQKLTHCDFLSLWLFCLTTDSASAKALDQDTCQETLENLVKAFQNVMDLHSKVSNNFIDFTESLLDPRVR